MSFVRLTGWCQILDDELPGTRRGAASLMIYFVQPDHPDGGSMAQTKRLLDVGPWSLLEIEAKVPEGTTKWFVSAGVFGPCTAAFDDIQIQTSRDDIDLVQGQLAVAHGDYQVIAENKISKPWVQLSVPFPLGGQTPLAIRVTSLPEDAVMGFQVKKDRENRPRRVFLKEMTAGDPIRFRVETLAYMRDRPLSTGEKVELTKASRVPRDVRDHLESAPGIDVESKRVQAAASSFSREDLGSILTDLRNYLKKNMTYVGGNTQGAEECLERGQAVCTGYANVAASMFIASQIPTRVLACTTMGGRLQEHYIVEAWTESLGWSRVESTAAMFPWGDTQNLVLRIVYPNAFRSPGDVPLYQEIAPGLKGGFDMGDDSCWQGGELFKTASLTSSDVEILEAMARSEFEKLGRRIHRDSKITLLPDEFDNKVGERGLRLRASLVAAIIL